MSTVSILSLAVECAWLILQKILLDVYDGVNVTDADRLIHGRGLLGAPAGSAVCRGFEGQLMRG